GRRPLRVTTSDGAPGRWGMLALIVAAQTMANVGPLGIPSIAPLIRQDLGLSMAQAGSFLSAYYIGAAIMSLPAGWMGDRWGVLATMVIGQALISAGLFGVAGFVSFSLLPPILILPRAGLRLLESPPAQGRHGVVPSSPARPRRRLQAGRPPPGRGRRRAHHAAPRPLARLAARGDDARRPRRGRRPVDVDALPRSTGLGVRRAWNGGR